MGGSGGGGCVEEEEEKSCCGSQLLLVEMKSKEGEKKNSNSWPAGFRFNPTDEELVLYYLKRKIFRRHIHLPSSVVVGDVDVYKWHPWELTEKCLSTSSREKQWYMFSPRDRKYPKGSRSSNRVTELGYWKATGKDRSITHRSRTVGNKKNLVYYHGRAPRGQRTDWIMHEYTLLHDHQELHLINTNNNTDYAFYKLFRKSGPGPPKNGEDYGAPFQEEDWEDADDDIFNEQTTTITSSSSKQGQVDSSSALDFDADTTLPDFNLEQVLLKLSSQLDVDHHSQSAISYVPQIQVEQEVQSHQIADATSVQHTNTWWEQGTGETSYQIAPSTSVVCAQSLEMPEVTSLIGCSEQGQLKADKEFIEITDFGDPGSVVWSMEDNSNNVCLPKNDGLYDPYDYFDAEMYLAEALGPLDGETPNLYLDDFGEENTELWTHEQDLSVSAATKPNQVASTSVSAAGVLSNNGSFSDISGGATQEPVSSHVGRPSDSWFSSALSAFLDSVPSSPAIAAESPLISKALQRVSSFRTGQTPGALVPNAATGNGSVNGRRRGTSSGGFLFMSFLVGLGAVVWVLTIGISVKISKGIWSRLS